MSLKIQGNDLIFNNRKKVGEIILDVDGDYYFIPLKNGGWYSEDGLRMVYELLKELNKNNRVMNYQEKVKDFQIAGGEDFSKGLTTLRESLLKEEIAELEQAIKDNNRVEILDALCDIKYVNDGNANILGVEQTQQFLEYDYNYYIPTHESLNGLKEEEVSNVNDIDLYVYALAYAFNFTLENFKTALYRVHESNMSKFPKTEQEAIDSVQAYKDKGVDTFYTDTFVVKRSSDGKILKSKYYHAVDLSYLV